MVARLCAFQAQWPPSWAARLNCDVMLRRVGCGRRLSPLLSPPLSASRALPLQSGGSVACNSRMVISAVFGDGKPTEVSTSSNPSLAQRVRTRSSDSHTPMMYRAPSPIAQWWRSSPAPVAPPRLMINACALSYARRNWSTSPSKRAISMTAIPCLQTLHGHEPTVANCRVRSAAIDRVASLRSSGGSLRRWSCGSHVVPVGCRNCAHDHWPAVSSIIRCSSCCLLVLADQPAEDPATPYLRCREIGNGNPSDLVSVRRAQVPGPVRATLVVKHDVLIQNRAQMS